jgi:Zn-dependent protease with chaperone function
LIQGWWYAVDSSARRSAELTVLGDRFVLKAADNGDVVGGSIEELEVSSRVGNIARRITLPDRSLFETEDNAGVDQLLSRFHPGVRKAGIIHHLETHWRWIGTAFLATLIIGFSAVYWGMPWASKKIAFSLPPSVLRVVSEQTLVIMDQSVLKPSELPQEQQQRIREHFKKMLATTHSEDYAYQIQFRSMGGIPNAFALPSGTIILTDSLVELADSQDEIDAVLLHEVGHVVHRHGMQSVLHSSFLTVAIILVSGDVTVVENMAVALPVFLLENHYSREDEAEADRFAFETMLRMEIDPAHFGRILTKISGREEEGSGAGSANRTAGEASQTDEGEPDSLMRYLSTHPETEERIRQANYYSELYKAKATGNQ